MGNRVLRPDQTEAIEELRYAIADGERRIVLQAPTGYGKTVLAGSIIDRTLARGKRVLFTVPALSLIDQAVESFRAEGINQIGVIQGYHELTNWDQPVQVASVQTLMRRKLPKANVVLIDECHRWFKFYAKWFLDQEWLNIPIIGLSATPWTKGLGAYYRRLIIAGTTAQLIESGHLSPFRVFAPSHPDLTGVRTMAGDYHEGDLSGAMLQGGLTADIVRTWLKLGEDRPTFLFAVDRAHAKELQNQFEAAGVSTAYMDAYTSLEEREAIRAKFHDGTYKIVCNVGVLTTGIDWDVRCLVMARPTKSAMLFVQIVGRALRTAQGKDYALILDHSDNHIRLGFVTDIHHEKLNDGKTVEREQRDGIQLPKKCSNCHFLKPPRMRVCPSCGFTSKPVMDPKPEEGELEELEPRKKDRAAAQFPHKEQTYGMLKQYAEERGHSEGWASHKFRELYGVWPNYYRDAQPEPPSLEILSWIKGSVRSSGKGRALPTTSIFSFCIGQSTVIPSNSRLAAKE